MADFIIKTIVHSINQMQISNSSAHSPFRPALIEGDVITIESDMKVVAAGNMVNLDGVLILNDGGHPLLLTADVVSQEVLADQNRRLVLRLNEYDKALWARYLQALGQTQVGVQRIMDKYKGSDE